MKNEEIDVVNCVEEESIVRPVLKKTIIKIRIFNM